MINKVSLLETKNYKLFLIHLKILYQASYLTFLPDVYSSINVKMNCDFIKKLKHLITRKIKIILNITGLVMMINIKSLLKQKIINCF